MNPVKPTPADFLGTAAGLMMTMRRVIETTDRDDPKQVALVLHSLHEHLAVAGGSVVFAAEMLGMKDEV